MATIIQSGDAEFAQQANTFCGKIDTYTVTLGLNPADVAAFKKDATLFTYVFKLLDPNRTYMQTLTNYKDLLRRGHNGDVLGAIPIAPVAPLPAPPLTSANMQGRFARLIAQIVASANYSKTIGEDLGIEAPVTPFNPADGKPTFKIEFSSGGHPNLIWKKGKFQGIEIWKSTDNGASWQKLDKDFSPDYTDKTDLPPVGQSKVWTYKLIYLYKDEVVGSYSNEASVTVYGAV